MKKRPANSRASERLLSVWLPPDLYEWISLQAAQETVSALQLKRRSVTMAQVTIKALSAYRAEREGATR